MVSSSNKKEERLLALKRLKDNRKNGNKSSLNILDTYSINNDENGIFKTLTEEEYKDLVRKRREEAPFVEDNDGEMGYYDDGEEHIFDRHIDENDEEIIDNNNNNNNNIIDNANQSKNTGALSNAYIKRLKKKQREKLTGGETTNSSNHTQKITKMFFKGNNSTILNTNHNHMIYKKKRKDIDINDMLNDLTANPVDARERSKKSNLNKIKKKRIHMDTKCKNVSTYNINFNNNDMMDGELETNDLNINEKYNLNINNNLSPNRQITINNDEDMQTKDESFDTSSIQEENVKVLTKREQLIEKARKEAQMKIASASIEHEIKNYKIDKSDKSDKNDKNDKNDENIKTIRIETADNIDQWWINNNIKQEEQYNMNTTDPVFHPDDNDTEIKMYWTDCVEIHERPGKIYLLGKTLVYDTVNKSMYTYQSCCAIIENLEKTLYLVPRLSISHINQYGKTLINYPEEIKKEIWMNMHQEIETVLRKYGLLVANNGSNNMIKTKLVERHYAFEDKDIPYGKNLYLKVKYNYNNITGKENNHVPPIDICQEGGETFSKIVNYSQNPVEAFLIGRKILGPSWLQLSRAKLLNNNNLNYPKVSYCKLEYLVDNPKHVSTLVATSSDNNIVNAPPIDVLSIGIKTIVNPSNQKHEIVAISGILEKNYSLSGNDEQLNKTYDHFTFVRPVQDQYPEAFIKAALDNPRFAGKNNLRFEVNERALLSLFLLKIQKMDPDIINSHNLHNYGLNLIITRLHDFNMSSNWSKLTRLRRGPLQPLKSNNASISYYNEYYTNDISNGRLFCDTNVAAKELLTSQNNYSLTYLLKQQLHINRSGDLESNDLIHILTNNEKKNLNNFISFLINISDDVFFMHLLMKNLNVIPLSKQLTTLCGYLWSKTLQANKRSERIEYLLLHEFNKKKKKFLLPEKHNKINKNNTKKSNKKVLNDTHLIQQPESTSKRKEPSYAGGLVFSPKAGLYDNYVVLLDFNSLYPSIIREYNICFTTVERDEISVDNKEENIDQDQITALPNSNLPEGILPEVIKRLLESRKQVKKLLKEAMGEKNNNKTNDSKVKTLDIRQKAIKLTANSMYGCLGSKFSRFYNKKIAALITATGRQTLTEAKDIAQDECHYQVIYGDTDSIMVDSRSRDYEKAIKIGQEIQIKCNKKFKLLELEVDFVFKKILLLNKKKYAAIVVKEDPQTNKLRYEKEVKGLDLVRRDWCKLSKEVGSQVLDFIMMDTKKSTNENSNDKNNIVTKDDIVEMIHDYLFTINERIRSNKESLSSFIITKNLNKQLEHYPEKNVQCHVQVALNMKKEGKIVNVGSCIPYVICNETIDNRKAFHPQEVVHKKLTIDVQWYLEAQIHPPVSRLCAHIEGTSSQQIGLCLGLNMEKSINIINNQNNSYEETYDTISSISQNDKERFKDCEPLTIRCKKCEKENSFLGVTHCLNYLNDEQFNDTFIQITDGIMCGNKDCSAEYWGYHKKGINDLMGDDFMAILSNRMTILIRYFCKKYYESYTICMDETCKNKTRSISLKKDLYNYNNHNNKSFTPCIIPECQGSVTTEYTHYDLYIQLKYFESLYDITKVKEKLIQNNKKIADINPNHLRIFNNLKEQIQDMIRLNDYNWVKPNFWKSLF